MEERIKRSKEKRRNRSGSLTNLVPRAFPLKNGWGLSHPTHFLREKSWERGWIVNVTIQSSWWICMESSEQTGAYISSPICTNRLIFSKGAFFISSFLNLNRGLERFQYSNWSTHLFCKINTSVSYLIEQIARFDFLQDPFFNFWHLFCLLVRIGVKSQCFVRTTDGICCVFPFQYRGIEYTNCATSEGKSPKMHWCATQAGFDETRNGTGWGYCAGQ